MPVKGKKFFAKILLFGEYSLLYGSGALTMPFQKYGARLVFPFRAMSHKQKKAALHSNEQLNAYRDFLMNDHAKPEADALLDLDKFAEELAQGIYLHSNIPSGFGLGSSGALVAALYDRYAIEPVSPNAGKEASEVLAWLQALFSRLESFFHGSSSGIDPLSIFVRQPLLIGTNKDLSLAVIPDELASGTGGFFLVNTHIPRKTSDLVAIFKEKMTQAAFRKIFMDEYIPCNNACIHTITSTPGEHADTHALLEKQMQALSVLQYELFSDMIPEIFRALWQEGLSSGTYAMKLCGAGGGGYLLGHTGNYSKAAEVWQQHTIVPTGLHGETINPPPRQ